jgi:hypothetical protein
VSNIYSVLEGSVGRKQLPQIGPLMLEANNRKPIKEPNTCWRKKRRIRDIRLEVQIKFYYHNHVHGKKQQIFLSRNNL